MSLWGGPEPWEGNDGRFAEGAAVRTPYPADGRGTPADRESWPWMAATVEEQRGPDEWRLTVEDRRVAMLADGSFAPDGTPDEELWFPQCFRDASEIREPEREADREQLAVWGAVRSPAASDAAPVIVTADPWAGREAGQ